MDIRQYKVGMTNLTTKLKAARSAMQKVAARGREVDKAIQLCQNLMDPPPSYTRGQAVIDRMHLAAICAGLNMGMSTPRATMLALAIQGTKNSPFVQAYVGVKALIAA